MSAEENTARRGESPPARQFRETPARFFSRAMFAESRRKRICPEGVFHNAPGLITGYVVSRTQNALLISAFEIPQEAKPGRCRTAHQNYTARFAACGKRCYALAGRRQMKRSVPGSGTLRVCFSRQAACVVLVQRVCAGGRCHNVVPVAF